MCMQRLTKKFILTSANSVFVAFAAVAIWSTVPLTIRLFLTLKRQSGLYFWSVLITTWGLCIRQIGILLGLLARQCPWALRIALSQTGWVMMVSGFSVVLYSRLSIIVQNRRTRRLVLGMIIFNGIVWHTIMTTTTTGKAWERSVGSNRKLEVWKNVDYYFERTHIVVFAAQETIISVLYIHAAYQYLKTGFAHKQKTRQIMAALLLVQVVIILIDIAIIVVDFMGYLQLKMFINSFVYATKLELEFLVLNQLVGLSKLGIPGVLNDISNNVQERPQPILFEKAAPSQYGLVAFVKPSASLDLESQRSRDSKSSGGSLNFITVPEGTR
jgi:hypothetical protein